MPIGNILHTHIHARIGALTHTHTLPTRHGDWRQTRRHREQTHTRTNRHTRQQHENNGNNGNAGWLFFFSFFLFFSLLPYDFWACRGVSLSYTHNAALDLLLLWASISCLALCVNALLLVETRARALDEFFLPIFVNNFYAPQAQTHTHTSARPTDECSARTKNIYNYRGTR